MFAQSHVNEDLLIKTYISNLVRTARFWNILQQVRSRSKDWNDKKFKVLRAISKSYAISKMV